MLPRLDLNLTPPSFILPLTGPIDDRHSSLIKRCDSCCTHCERRAVPQSVLLSDSPFEELAVRPTTRKTHLTVSVCASRLVSPLNDSPAADTHGLLMSELKIGLHLKAESSLFYTAFISGGFSCCSFNKKFNLIRYRSFRPHDNLFFSLFLHFQEVKFKTDNSVM